MSNLQLSVYCAFAIYWRMHSIAEVILQCNGLFKGNNYVFIFVLFLLGFGFDYPKGAEKFHYAT